MKRFLYTLIIIMSLFCASGCSSSKNENATITIDTVGVIAFTDNLMNDAGYDIVQKSVSQHTGNTNRFLVEYWWQTNDDSGHYGYYIQQLDRDNYIVLKEGENIDKDIFIETNQ